MKPQLSNLYFKKRGVILITVLLLLTIVIMILTLLMTSARNSIRLADSYSDGEKAYYAAMSGMEYVRHRLYDDGSWMQRVGTGEAKLPVIIRDGDNKLILKVMEDPKIGLVKGELYNGEEHLYAEFEVAFADLMLASSPEPVYSKPFPEGINYLSCNNFIKTSEASIYKLDRGRMVRERMIPPGSVSVIVKGCSGNIKKYASANLSILEKRGMMSSSVSRGDVNVVLIDDRSTFMNGDVNNKPASLRAQGTNVNSGGINISSIDKNTSCFVLDNDGTAYAPNFRINNNYIVFPSSQTNDINKKAETYGVKLDNSPAERAQTMTLLQGADYLEWNNLNTQYSTGQSFSISSGAYLYDLKTRDWKFFSSDKIVISPNGEELFIKKGSHPVSASSSEFFKLTGIINNRDPLVSIKNSVSSTQSLFFAVLDELPASSDPVLIRTSLSPQSAILGDGLDNLPDVAPIKKEKIVDLSSSTMQLVDATVTSISPNRRVVVDFKEDNSVLWVGKECASLPSENSPDSLVICGQLKGSGKIFSKGDIFFQGGSYFETEKNTGVAVYADRNLKIMPATGKIPDNVNSVIKEAWQKLYNYGPSSFANMNEVLNSLLGTKVSADSTGDSTLEDYLKTIIPDKQDRDILLKTIISNNSYFYGNGVIPSYADTSFSHSFHPTQPFSTINPVSSLPELSLPQDSSSYSTNDNSLPELGWNVTSDATITAIKTYEPIELLNPTSDPSKYQRTTINNGDLASRKEYYKIVVHTKSNYKLTKLRVKGNQVQDELLPIQEQILHILGKEGYEKIQPLLEHVNKSVDSKVCIYIPTDPNILNSSNAEAYITKQYCHKGGNIYEYEKPSECIKPAHGGTLKDRISASGFPVNAEQVTFKLLPNVDSELDIRLNEGAFLRKVDSTDDNIWEVFTLQQEYVGTADSLDNYTKLNCDLMKLGVQYDYLRNRMLDPKVLPRSSDNKVLAITFSPEGTIFSKCGGSESFVNPVVPPDTGQTRLYIEKDIKQSSFLNPNDTILKGMFFTRNGSFMTNIGHGSLAIRGGIIAYGGDINIAGGSSFLYYDPSYMSFFKNCGILSSYSFCAVFDDFNK